MNVKYIVFLDTSCNITNKVWQTTSIGNKSLRGLLKQTIIMINFNMTLKIKLSIFFFFFFFVLLFCLPKSQSYVPQKDQQNEKNKLHLLTPCISVPSLIRKKLQSMNDLLF